MFTSALVEGLRSGDADRGGDGYVSVDELYEYVYAQVDERPRPNLAVGLSTWRVNLIIATSVRAARPNCPPRCGPRSKARSPVAALAAVTELARIMTGHHRGLADAARTALDALRESDDSMRVRNAAHRKPPTANAPSSQLKQQRRGMPRPKNTPWSRCSSPPKR